MNKEFMELVHVQAIVEDACRNSYTFYHPMNVMDDVIDCTSLGCGSWCYQAMIDLKNEKNEGV